MIFKAIFDLLFGLVNFVIGLFPAWTAPSTTGATTAASTLGGYLTVVGRFIDLPLLVTVIQTLAAVFVSAVTVKGLLFIYRLIPGVG